MTLRRIKIRIWKISGKEFYQAGRQILNIDFFNRIGCFQSFHTALTAQRTIADFEAMLCLKKGFDFARTVDRS